MLRSTDLLLATFNIYPHLAQCIPQNINVEIDLGQIPFQIIEQVTTSLLTQGFQAGLSMFASLDLDFMNEVEMNWGKVLLAVHGQILHHLDHGSEHLHLLNEGVKLFQLTLAVWDGDGGISCYCYGVSSLAWVSATLEVVAIE